MAVTAVAVYKDVLGVGTGSKQVGQMAGAAAGCTVPGDRSTGIGRSCRTAVALAGAVAVVGRTLASRAGPGLAGKILPVSGCVGGTGHAGTLQVDIAAGITGTGCMLEVRSGGMTVVTGKGSV